LNKNRRAVLLNDLREIQDTTMRDDDIMPAYRDTRTNAVYVAKLHDGTPSPLHTLEGLPRELIDKFDDTGSPLQLKPFVDVGFVIGERFFTSSESLDLTANRHHAHQ
jgi:hypothetical protein